LAKTDAMHDGTILAETIAGIEKILADDLDRICVERAAVGLFFTGVKLNTGTAGACATPLHGVVEEAHGRYVGVRGLRDKHIAIGQHVDPARVLETGRKGIDLRVPALQPAFAPRPIPGRSAS
jgi:Putative heavy-metal chelation